MTLTGMRSHKPAGIRRQKKTNIAKRQSIITRRRRCSMARTTLRATGSKGMSIG